MKTLILVPLLAVVAVSCVTSPPPPNPAGKLNCCPANRVPDAAFTDKSLYQLEATWTNDFGQLRQLGELRGRVQVVAMFFATCTYACPIIVHDLQRIEAALPESERQKVGFTLITIDPERDTPAALHAYRATRQLPAPQWTILRGGPDHTLELAALLGVKFKREATGQFAHSNLITVLNPEGEISHQLAGLNQNVAETVRQITDACSHLPQTP